MASSLQSFTWLWIHCIFLHSDISQATSKLYWQKELGPNFSPSCWMQHRVQSYILNWIRGMLIPLIDELLSLSLVCFFMLKPLEDLVFTGCNGLWSFPSKKHRTQKSEWITETESNIHKLRWWWKIKGAYLPHWQPSSQYPPQSPIHPPRPLSVSAIVTSYQFSPKTCSKKHNFLDKLRYSSV